MVTRPFAPRIRTAIGRARGSGTRRRLVAVAIGALLVVGAATARLFVWPDTGAVGAADAVALFVGGRGERLSTALEIIAEREVEHLVIPNGTDPAWPEANALCSGEHDVRVWCPTPQPDTTRGEARVIARLAEDNGWNRVVVVTSDYHLTRARLLLSRCYDGDVVPVSAASGLGPISRMTRIVHEWIAFANARVLDRSC